MTGIYYVEALEVLKAAGCAVAENSTTDGWQTRARSSGGFPHRPLGVFWHHTASSTTPANDLAFMCGGSDDAPVGNMLIDRDGVCWPVAAGASNCAGKGGPVTLTRGTIPLDAGNSNGWQIEVANSGVGERWPQAQVDACFRASNALNAHFGNQPFDVVTHALGAGDGWTDRKIDPATADAVEGPWQPSPVNSSGTWLQADVRAECVLRSTPTTPPPEEDDMLRTVLVPTFPGGEAMPWLALFDSGVVRPLASHEPEPLGGKHDLPDEGQYRQLCEWAGVNL
jgi:hypothetical protein